MPPDRDALDAAMDALQEAQSAYDADEYVGNVGDEGSYAPVIAAARAAVRRLAEQGEVFTVESIIVPGEADRGRVPVVIFDDNCPTCPRPGDRVRVTRIEEAP